MTESKIELTERLRREGRWSEASKFKDVALKDLRSKGMTKAEAAEAAWDAMAKAYPPLPAPEGQAVPIANGAEPEPSRAPAATADHRGQNGPGAATVPTPAEELIDVDALLERVGDRQPPDLVRDTLWTYENLLNRKAKPENAPSLGAWSLLLWARQYRNRFFEQVLPKAMLNKPSEDEENIRQEKKSIAEITAILEKLRQPSAEEFAELAADVPGTVRQRVREVLADWAPRRGLTIPDEAQADLEAHLSRLVRDCVDALAPSGAE